MSATATAQAAEPEAEPHSTLAKLVTASVGDQRIGIPIDKVRDVFMAGSITAVPLAPAHIAGLVNLRGKIVTVLSLRAMMGFPPRPQSRTVVGLEWHNEAFGLLVDKIGEVIDMPPGSLEPNPPNLDGHWAALSAGVRSLADGLLLQLDTEKLFQPLAEDMLS
jgi:purine-binding chemotaxis protein CheW